MPKSKVLIIGAAGRDFHNFNVLLRNNNDYEVVGFTAAQIPDISGRIYPASLAGEKLYPQGLPIFDESELEKIIKEKKVDLAILSYSDLSPEKVMSIAHRVISSGADFVLASVQGTMLKSAKPVIAVVAVRTGCGKSQISRAISTAIGKGFNKKVVSIRHPMPYGDLEEQAVQRFATIDDLKKHKCTIEEMEEYEPHVVAGSVIYAGVDYQAILDEAEKEADVIIWDGGNNDTSFYEPNLTITVVDAHRPGDEKNYYPGVANVMLSDVVIINKIDSAPAENVLLIEENIKNLNPKALIIKAESDIIIENPENITIKGKKVLVIEDGPSTTHGNMKTGAATVAAQRSGVIEFVDPRPYAVGTIKETFNIYPKIGNLLPAMGYSPQQIQDLAETINNTPCDLVVIGTPIDLRRIIDIKKPCVRVSYELPGNILEELMNVILEKGII